MRILFLPGDYAFCYYYRGYLPGVYANQGVVLDMIRNGSKPDPQTLTKMALQSDVIVFQRPTDRKYYDLAKLLKSNGKKIIFENDDTYGGIPLERLDNQKQIDLANEYKKNIIDFLELSDGAIASTEILADEFRKTNPNVAVLKNCIDPLDKLTPKKNNTGKFRVGFIGSVTSNDDYNHIKDQLIQLSNRDDVTIVVMGVKTANGDVLKTMQPDADFWSSLKNVEWHPYCPVIEYMNKLNNLRLDVAIIPRLDHYFNKCKSNLKFLEMSLLKIPVVAQGFSDGKSPYQGEDANYMTVVVDNSTWLETILNVQSNYEKYSRLAEKAHEYVLDNYNIKNYAHEWVKTIEKLCNYQKNS